MQTRKKAFVIFGASAALIGLIAYAYIAYEVSPQTAERRLWAAADGRAASSQEAVRRVRDYLSYTISSIDPETGLFPENAGKDKFWVPRNNAADNYPYAVIAARLFGDQAQESSLQDVLEAEKRLTTRFGGLVDDYDISQGEFAYPPDIGRAIFNAAEYAKDGLLPIVDATGRGSLWAARLIGLVGSIWQNKPLWTGGDVPSDRAEVNGDLLMVLSRLFWLTGDNGYISMASDIADHYLFKDPMLVPGTTLHLRDHGNEVLVGLSEFYYALRRAEPDLSDRYARPIKELMDAALLYGKGKDGLLQDYADLPPKAPARSGHLDNWGYVADALLTMDIADHSDSYGHAVKGLVDSVASLAGDPAWEPRYPYDGYADSIESMLMVLRFAAGPTAPKADRWIDQSMRAMWHLEDTVVKLSPTYLYGNGARTSMMYALYISQGLRLSPWPEGAGVGAVTSSGRKILIEIRSDSDVGPLKLYADQSRHENVWGMPDDYPRINALPERFVPYAGSRYIIEDLTTGSIADVSGDGLASGLDIRLKKGANLFTITSL